MIEPHDKQNDRESMLMPLVFISYENYLQSSKSFQDGLNWMEVSKICQKPTKYGQVMFCEALNSLTGNYVFAGRKIVLFGRYVRDLYVGKVQ
jgi:hypothetical protein